MKVAFVFAAALLLMGCGPSPLLHVGNAVFNFGQGLPADMVQTNLAGTVAFDEDWAGNYQRVARNALYVQGIEPNTPEYGMRVVRINLLNTGEGIGLAKGQLLFMTGAMVPDHLPRLKAGDIVEVRNVGTWRTMQDFLSKKDGNIVLHLLCSRAQSDYEECRDRGPRTGTFVGAGATHTAYPQDIAPYGYAFTPKYDQSGKALR